MYFINDTLVGTRFDLARFCDFTQSIFDDLNSYFIDSILQLNPVGAYVVQREAKRPDLLSMNLYGHTQYWWILLLYNGLVSHEDLTIGKTVAYPSLDQLEDIYFRLKSLGQGISI